jgi:hypothetical protein
LHLVILHSHPSTISSRHNLPVFFPHTQQHLLPSAQGARLPSSPWRPSPSSSSRRPSMLPPLPFFSHGRELHLPCFVRRAEAPPWQAPRRASPMALGSLFPGALWSPPFSPGRAHPSSGSPPFRQDQLQFCAPPPLAPLRLPWPPALPASSAPPHSWRPLLFPARPGNAQAGSALSLSLLLSLYQAPPCNLPQAVFLLSPTATSSFPLCSRPASGQCAQALPAKDNSIPSPAAARPLPPFPLVRQQGTPVLPAAKASKFSAQRCRSKTAASDPLRIACFARSAQSRPTPSRWCLGTAHVVSLICAVRPSTCLTSPDLRSPNIDDVHPGETTMIFV